jgi:hypothetical protein
MTEQPETGSPSAEFNKMLASDMPLVDVVRHWERTVLPNISSLEELNALPDAEGTAYALTMVEGWDTYVIDQARADANYLSIDSVQRDCWTELENARLALRSATTGTSQ